MKAILGLGYIKVRFTNDLTYSMKAILGLGYIKVRFTNDLIYSINEREFFELPDL